MLDTCALVSVAVRQIIQLFHNMFKRSNWTFDRRSSLALC
jgi:hypothetical protein